MAKQNQGESMPLPGMASDIVKEAPKAKGKTLGSKGNPMEKASQEIASMAPKHKGSKPAHSGVPATDPKPHAASFDASKMELDGHKLKKPSKRK